VLNQLNRQLASQLVSQVSQHQLNLNPSHINHHTNT
jgi:hypothetical protein